MNEASYIEIESEYNFTPILVRLYMITPSLWGPQDGRVSSKSRGQINWKRW